MTVEMLCGNSHNSEPISIQLRTDLIADLLITETSKTLRSSREEVSVFLCEGSDFTPNFPSELRLELARKAFDAIVGEQLLALYEYVEEYMQSARGEAFLRAVRESILLDIHTAAMADLAARNGLVQLTPHPGEFVQMIVKPLERALRDQLKVKRGGPRRYFPPDSDPVWPRFAARTSELRPVWAQARRTEEPPRLDRLSPAHRKKLLAHFTGREKKLKPLYLALLQAGAEYELWDPTRPRLPHESLANKYRKHRTST